MYSSSLSSSIVPSFVRVVRSIEAIESRASVERIDLKSVISTIPGLDVKYVNVLVELSAEPGFAGLAEILSSLVKDEVAASVAKSKILSSLSYSALSCVPTGTVVGLIEPSTSE